MLEHRPPVRFYLTGRVCIEVAGAERPALIDQSQLPGRQGRSALVYLVVERGRPVSPDELAAALWGDSLPPSWLTSLRAIVSKLRAVLASSGRDLAIAGDGGCYQVVLGDSWVDVSGAFNSVDRAEGALRRRDGGVAWSEATVAAAITRRPFLPGVDRPWVGAERGRLRGARVRALDVLVEVLLARGDHPVALEIARELVHLEPYREAGHRQLMRAHLGAGERGEAARVYEGLRRLLAEELGVDPAPETQQVWRQALGSWTGT